MTENIPKLLKDVSFILRKSGKKKKKKQINTKKTKTKQKGKKLTQVHCGQGTENQSKRENSKEAYQ